MQKFENQRKINGKSMKNQWKIDRKSMKNKWKINEKSMENQIFANPVTTPKATPPNRGVRGKFFSRRATRKHFFAYPCAKTIKRRATRDLADPVAAKKPTPPT